MNKVYKLVSIFKPLIQLRRNL